MSTGRRLIYARKDIDSVLKAVLADIHKTAEKPAPGYLTREQWAAKWKLKANANAEIYLKRALAIGVLVRRDYRVVTKGRLRKMAHFGPPSKRKAP